MTSQTVLKIQLIQFICSSPASSQTWHVAAGIHGPCQPTRKEQRDLGEGSLLLLTVHTSDEIDWKQLVTSISYVESIQFTQPTSNKLFLSSSPLPCGECRSVHACFKWLILASANATEMQVAHACTRSECRSDKGPGHLGLRSAIPLKCCVC